VFLSRFFDKETNTHYNYFRDYDPAIGRYVQSDPIGLEGGINTYAYVGGNPLRYAPVSKGSGLYFIDVGGYAGAWLVRCGWNSPVRSTT
jgi:RHS repeat-associated protein